MKGVFICLIAVVFSGCTKPDEGMNSWRSDMTFTSVQTSCVRLMILYYSAKIHEFKV